MKINTEIIRNLKPCESRFDNYLKHYSDFDGTLEDFVLLDKITYDDKIWVITRLFTEKQNVTFAIKCASSVLRVFEQKFPNDSRPRLALEAAESWLNNPTEENTEAAATANAAAARAAAATANAANAAADAAYAAAAYAATANAAADAATADDRKSQKELNLIFAVEVANG